MPDVKVGQVWRRKRGGVTVRVETIIKGYYSPGDDDIRWRRTDGHGRGGIFSDTFRARYELVEDVDA